MLIQHPFSPYVNDFQFFYISVDTPWCFRIMSQPPSTSSATGGFQRRADAGTAAHSQGHPAVRKCPGRCTTGWDFWDHPSSSHGNHGNHGIKPQISMEIGGDFIIVTIAMTKQYLWVLWLNFTTKIRTRSKKLRTSELVEDRPVLCCLLPKVHC
jgi:hypothetical protein